MMLVILLVALGSLIAWAASKKTTEKQQRLSHRHQFADLLGQLFENGFEFVGLHQFAIEAATRTALQYDQIPYHFTGRPLSLKSDPSAGGRDLLWKEIGLILQRSGVSQVELFSKAPTLEREISEFRQSPSRELFIKTIKSLNAFLKNKSVGLRVYACYGDMSPAFPQKVEGLILTDRLYDILVTNPLVKPYQIPHLVPES